MRSYKQDDHGAVLPLGLRRLELSSVDDMGHVLQLTGLTSLALHMAAEVSVGQLLRLTTLGSLAHLQLGYCTTAMRYTAHKLPGFDMLDGSESLAAKAESVLLQHAAQAWAALPLRHLSIGANPRHGRLKLPAEVLPHLGQLSSLTCLGCLCILPVAFQATLLQLQGLQELHLRMRAPLRSSRESELYGHQLMRVVAKLPHLTSLSLSGVHGHANALNQAAMRELVAAPKLQRLQLSQVKCASYITVVQKFLARRGFPCQVEVLDDENVWSSDDEDLGRSEDAPLGCNVQ